MSSQEPIITEIDGVYFNSTGLALKEYIDKMHKSKLKIKKLHPDAIIPTRAHSNDAGYDLYSSEDIWIPAGVTLKISTGIAIQPPKGFYGKILERSSMGSKGLAVRAGVCDEGYTGEYVVCMTNTTDRSYHIQQKDKIAQVVFHRYGDFEIQEVEEFDETERGELGFGSSGA